MFLLIDGVYEKTAQGVFWGKQGYGMTAKGHKVSETSHKHCFYFSTVLSVKSIRANYKLHISKLLKANSKCSHHRKISIFVDGSAN